MSETHKSSPAQALARARESENLQSKLLEAHDGERLDTGTTGAHQARLIRTWRPWEKSTEPTKAKGKARVSRKGYKGWTRQLLHQLKRALREQVVARHRLGIDSRSGGADHAASVCKNTNLKIQKVIRKTIQHHSSSRSAHLTLPKYREDIDGLRAIAVLSVVSFHASPFWVKGGFVGVDIFFVISGFLISTIIFSSLEGNSFSFIEFYSRRVKRIFPALLLVLIASYAFGWFALLADEYKQLGKHIAAGAGFVANIIFWSESGYFDNAAETKPLLHLWSLGIEEQFYIVWPLLLWAAWKKRFNLLSITIAVAAISFILNVRGIGRDAVATFYSPQTRFWELQAGSLLAWFTLYKQDSFAMFKNKLDAWLGQIVYAQAPVNGTTLRNIQALLGALLIAAAVFVTTKERLLPGWWAVLPTLGAILIISAGAQAWLNRTLLSNRVLVWFGLISYPLYLWHWPLLSFARIVTSDVPSREIRIAAAVVVSIVLAWLTYRLIETPIRFGERKKTRTTVILVVLMALVGYIGYNGYKRDGLAFRLKDRKDYAEYFANSAPEWKYYERLGILEKYRIECNFYDVPNYRIGKITNIPLQTIDPSCYERNLNKGKALFLWGDSHVSQLYFGLRNNLPDEWQILTVATSGCAPRPDEQQDSQNDSCKKSNWFALKTIAETKPDVVLVAQAGGHSLKAMKAISLKLKSSGIKRVVFTGPTPHWIDDLPKIILRYLWLSTPRRTYKLIDEDILKENSVLKENFKHSDSEVFVDLIGFFCNDAGCLTYLGDDKKTGITTFDYGHLAPIASDYLAKNLLANIITKSIVK